MLCIQADIFHGRDSLTRTIQYYIDRHAKNTLKHINNKLRRFVLCTFNQKYVEKKQQARYGDCFHCGKCCSLLLKCPFLEGTDGNTKCAIYNNGRPKQCEAFPIDPKDLHDVDYLCGYFFSEELKNSEFSMTK